MKGKAFLLILLSILPLLMVAVLYPKLPEMVPVHWDLDGGVTYGEKIKLFPMAGLSLVFWILMPLFAKIDPRKQNYERFADAYFGTRIILLVFMIVMMSITLTESLYPGLLQVIKTPDGFPSGVRFFISPWAKSGSAAPP